MRFELKANQRFAVRLICMEQIKTRNARPFFVGDWLQPVIRFQTYKGIWKTLI
jgi:hypothetical protein